MGETARVAFDRADHRVPFVAARNRALKHLRHRRVAARVHEQKALEQSQQTAGGADHAVEYREAVAAVESAITELPDRCREIFLLSRQQELGER